MVYGAIVIMLPYLTSARRTIIEAQGIFFWVQTDFIEVLAISFFDEYLLLLWIV